MPIVMTGKRFQQSSGGVTSSTNYSLPNGENSDIWIESSFTTNTLIDFQDNGSASLPFIGINGSPIKIDDAFSNSVDGIYLKDSDKILFANSHAPIANNNLTSRSYIIAFKTGNDIQSNQVIYAEGGDTNGLTLAISNGEFRAHAYVSGQSTGFTSSQIQSNTKYVFGFDLDSSTNQQQLWTDIGVVDSYNSKSIWGIHNGDPGIGGSDDGEVFPGGGTTSNNDFTFGGMVTYSSKLTEVETKQVMNFFSQRYLNVTYFSGESSEKISNNLLLDFDVSNSAVFQLEAVDRTPNPIYNLASAESYSNLSVPLQFGSFTVGNKPAFYFDNTTINIGSNINSGDVERTYVFAFKTGSDVNSRQIVFDQGGGDTGASAGIENGEFKVHAYTDYQSGTNSSDTCSYSITTNTEYVFVFNYEPNGSGGYDQNLIFEGSVVSTITKDGAIVNQTDGGALGGVNGETVFPGDIDPSTNSYNSTDLSIAAVMIYNPKLTSTQSNQVSDYFWKTYFNRDIYGLSSKEIPAKNNLIFWVESDLQIKSVPQIYDNGVKTTFSVSGLLGITEVDFFTVNRDAIDISSPYLLGTSTVNGSSGDRFYSFVFQTGSDIITDQVIFEHGGSTNGFCLAITNGELRAHYYQNKSSSPYLSMNVNANTPYLISTEYLSGTQNLWENDVVVDTITKSLSSGSNSNGFGGINGSTLIPGGNEINNTGTPFLGNIGASICFVNTFTSQEKTEILNYLSENYLGTSLI